MGVYIHTWFLSEVKMTFLVVLVTIFLAAPKFRMLESHMNGQKSTQRPSWGQMFLSILSICVNIWHLFCNSFCHIDVLKITPALFMWCSVSQRELWWIFFSDDRCAHVLNRVRPRCNIWKYFSRSLNSKIETTIRLKHLNNRNRPDLLD